MWCYLIGGVYHPGDASFLKYNKDFSSMIKAARLAIALANYTVGPYQLGLPTPAVRQRKHAR